MDRAKDIKLQLVVLFMREFGWPYEYAKKTIGVMPLDELNEISGELTYQRSVEAHERAQNTASLMATMWNTTPQKHPKARKAKDFVGSPPRRSGEKEVKTLREAAEDMGIRIPEGGIE